MRTVSIISLLVLALLVSSCSLLDTVSQPAASAPTATPTQTETQAFPPTPTPTLTPFPTLTPIPTLACVVWTDWPVYVVVPGDTLYKIAQRVGSTTAVLAQANCMVNPNLIEVGQQIRVPQIPVIVPTFTPVPPPPYYGPVNVAPATYADRWWTVSSLPVTLSWPYAPGAAAGAARVDFYVTPTGTGMEGAEMLLGSDTYLADGASIVYYQNFFGHVQAIAYAPNGDVIAASELTNVSGFVGLPPPVFGPLTFSPAWDVGNGSTWVITGLPVTISWPQVPVTTDRVEFYVGPTGTGVGGMEQIIGTVEQPGTAASLVYNQPLYGRVFARAYAAGTVIGESAPVLVDMEMFP